MLLVSPNAFARGGPANQTWSSARYVAGWRDTLADITVSGAAEHPSESILFEQWSYHRTNDYSKLQIGLGVAIDSPLGGAVLLHPFFRLLWVRICLSTLAS